MDDLKTALIRYGVELMAAQLGQQLPDSWPDPWRQHLFNSQSPEMAQKRLRRAITILQAQPPSSKDAPRPISSVFGQLSDISGKRFPAYDLPLHVLSTSLDNLHASSGSELWQGFRDEFLRLEDGTGTFETFVNLVMKYGSFVRGTLESDFVSVYEQFKAVAAVAHTLPEDQKANDLLLVSGDLPGIQDMLYTISSKGVAKGLRGRSFYLQLLNDALVRNILQELSLPTACVIYNAGGNFKLMARVEDRAKLDSLYLDLNRRLLALHRGELRLAMAWLPVDAADLQTIAFSEAVEQVTRKLRWEKLSAWSMTEAQHDSKVGSPSTPSVFEPIGFGGLGFCVVCHVELENDQRDKMCKQCESFEDLGEKIKASFLNPKLSISPIPSALPEILQRDKPTWQEVLRVFGFEYRFGDQARPRPNGVLYSLNEGNFLPSTLDSSCAYAFRPMAHFTPFVEPDEDLHRLQDKLKDEEGDQVNFGYIRSTTLMASADATGISRYGVLRMDVDGLGEAWRELNLLATSTLSAAIGLFLEGWLNGVCEQVGDEWKAAAQECVLDEEAEKRVKKPYIIYAGGDDLFVIGTWDVLPELAWRIRHDWESYVRKGYIDKDEKIRPVPSDAPEPPLPLTFSAGIFAEGAKFPLYQAAEQAKEALNRAKQRKVVMRGRQVFVKDAIDFMGMTLPWFRFERARKLAYELARLSSKGKNGNGAEPVTLPHGFLSMLGSVAHLYQKDAERAVNSQPVYGRWMWRLAYALRRTAERYSTLETEVKTIAGDASDLTQLEHARDWETASYLSLPVRWAEYLIRKGG